MKVSAEYVERYKISVEDLPKLQGFYGSKLKAGATAVLTGIYSVPIYAQWNYGKGIVGSFMCDLNGEFSGDLLEGEAGIDLKNLLWARSLP